MLCMETEDEEFEQLLEEIPRAMERTTQGYCQDPAEDGLMTEESSCMARSQSVESLHDIFEAFGAKPEPEFRKIDPARTTKTGLSDCFVDRDLGLHFPSKEVESREEYSESVQREAAADASLPLMFANLQLKVGDCMRPNVPYHRHGEVSSNISLQEVSTRLPDSGCFESTPNHLLGFHNNVGHGHVYGRPLGLQHGVLSHPQCDGVSTLFYRKVNDLDPGIDCTDKFFGHSARPNHPLTYQVAVPPSTQDRLVPNRFLNGKDGWLLNSRLFANHQAQQLCKLNLEQEHMNSDRVWGCHRQDFVDVQYSNGTPAFTVGKDHGYSCLKDSSTFSPTSCGHPFRQRFANSYVDNFCTYCTQAICSKGYVLSALRDELGGAAMNKDHQVDPAPLNLLKAPTASVLCNKKAEVRIWPRKITRVVPEHSPTMGCCSDDAPSVFKESFEGNQHSITALKKPSKQENLMTVAWAPHKPDCLKQAMEQGPLNSWSSLVDIEGCILAIAKDQHGCRFLQRKFDEGLPEDIQKIFKEVLDNVVDLMVDPFGNYLVQKLFEVCTDDQRSDLLQSITNNGGLVNVSLNIHGTRAVQKLVETLKSWEHVAVVTASLRSGVVALIKDLNGNHVIQRCLQHLSNEDNEFIFEAAAHNCVEIATHRHGCCVLQRCIDHSSGLARKRLIWEIASNSLQLAQDSFGNYVVQYVLELGLPWAIQEVVNRLMGEFVPLSIQKFSSNVVENCLRLCGEESKPYIIQELIDSPQLLDLMQDPYANYVIQSALMVSKGTLHATIVEAIRPHIPFLRNNPYGKRILSRRNFKKI